MDGINKRLFDWAKESILIENLGWLGGNEDDLKIALDKNESDRFDATIRLCKLIWGKYPDYGIFPDLFLLGEMEVGQAYYPNYRDHSTHVFKVYLLGLYIYENNLILHKLFDDQDRFIRTWTIASLWHDMGYLFDNEESAVDEDGLWESVSNRINAQFKKSLNSVAGFDGNLSADALTRFYDVSRIDCSPLKSLREFENDAEIFEHLRPAGIASGLANSVLTANAIMEIYSVIRGKDAPSGRKPHIDHGIFSSLLLLKLWFSYKTMFEDIAIFASEPKNNTTTNLINGVLSGVKTVNKSIIDSDAVNVIIEAAQAVALHNIKIADVKASALVHTGINIENFKIVIEDKGLYKAQPYAYLLKLVDELQDWDRQEFVRKVEGNNVINGDDMDIFASRKNIWIWYKNDNKYRNPEQQGSKFSKIKSSLSNMELGGLLRGMKNYQRPNREKIAKLREEFHAVFYSKIAVGFMEHMIEERGCKKIKVLLYNRKDGTFGFLRTNGEITLITDKMTHDIAKKFYFENDSGFYENESNGKTTGFSLISTHVGPLGFLVLEDVSEEDSFDRELNENHADEVAIDDYGLMYGTVVFRNIQRRIDKKMTTKTLFIGDENDNDSLITQLNDYIPFGRNDCISVFLDIRGLSNLFDGDINRQQRALEFITEFSEIVEDVSRNHYGMITCHFGGGMLITFNQIIHEKLNMSCFRAICTMHEIRALFEKELRPLAKEWFGEENAAKISIAMGASAGEAIFSTLGCNPSVFYTGMGRDIGLSKKIENISERDEVIINEIPTSCKERIFVSEEVFRYCSQRSNHGVKLHPVNGLCVSHSKEGQTLYHIGCENAYKCKCHLHSKCEDCRDKDHEPSQHSCEGCIDIQKCPLTRICKGCPKIIEESRR